MDRGCTTPPPPAKGSAWKTIFSHDSDPLPTGDRLTKPNFALATPKDLRKDLERWELTTTGDKAQLEARLRAWITIYK